MGGVVGDGVSVDDAVPDMDGDAVIDGDVDGVVDGDTVPEIVAVRLPDWLGEPVMLGEPVLEVVRLADGLVEPDTLGDPV